MLGYFLVLLSLLVSKSLYYETFGENYLLLFTVLILLLILIFNGAYSRLKFSKGSIIGLIVVVLSVVVNFSFALTTVSVFITALYAAFLLRTLVSYKSFALKFFRIVNVLMCFSLLRYLVIIFSLDSSLPDFISIEGDHYKNFVFFGVLKTQTTYFQLLRNNGLWWEPGAFQVIINLSYIFGLSLDMINKRYFILYFVIILSTFSTAGFLVFAMLSIIFVRRNFSIATGMLIILISVPFILFSGFYNEVIGSKVNLDHGSTLSRFNDSMLALRIFVENPFFGIGLGNVDSIDVYTRRYDYGTGSNGILLLFSYLGIFAFFIFFYLAVPAYLVYFRNKFERVIVAISFILIFFSQNFIIILIFSILIVYGFRRYSSSS